MKETGIIMTGDHPAKILDGTKTMTRRVITLKGYSQRIWDECVSHNGEEAELLGEPYLKVPFDPIVDNTGTRITCPYGQVGDRLWVRETFCDILYQVSDSHSADYIYKAQWDKPLPYGGKWKSSRFMPKVAARIWLEITGVRVERLQDISLQDVLAEGVTQDMYNTAPTKTFELLWDSINAKRGYGWAANPWVWVISFRRLNG